MTANPSVASDACTASPCGSRIPAFGRMSTVTCTHDLRLGQVAGERDTGQQLERLDVPRPRPGHDVVGQLRPRRRAVPAGVEAPVAHELLVERRLRPAGRVPVGGPEAGRVGRQRLVAQRDHAVRVEPELELRVGEEDSPFGRMLVRGGIEGERGRSRAAA